ncbi:hypothetical protein L226DRAFT_615782 [Lentinus tigrinus ALCF2SS1-7]|uniref:F-box domain-containing protein n=1 Tax=Lentinus tigrinus ALCF2SS1-6 TaxID=1328759 RepID=A0A5C2RYY2_9APHY|nr:hypothetical protein L227DRAFT_614673 [Lentinus tigrinus ALCF2SS1-6]RPD71060.1 hypothetical protein L226DRAFT_615782 [Lentinus tigrinus ALCF2SS1-7]
MEALGIAARDFLGRCQALLNEENHHPVDIESVRTIERDLQLAVIAIKQYYNASPFAPINRLHPELLCMIFKHVRRPNKAVMSARLHPSRFDSYKPLLAPMLACRKWHTLITQDATLWNQIDLTKHTPTSALVQRLLERSKGASLDVRFAHSSLRFVEDKDKTTPFLEVHAHRLGKLEVKFRDVNCTPEMLSLLDISMPRLTCLVISITEQLLKSVHEVSLKRFPALKKLVLSGILLRPIEHVPSLTHLHLIGLVHDTILPLLDVLGAAPSLEILDLRMIQLGTRGVEAPILNLPRLRVLRLTCRTWSTVVRFLLTHIAAPNLMVTDFSEVSSWRDSGNTAVDAYIPQTFLAQRSRMTRLGVSWHYGKGFTATFQSADSNDRLTIEENCPVLRSVLGTSPMLDCLRNIEHVCLDPQPVDMDEHEVLWILQRLPIAKFLVLNNVWHGLRLLDSKVPIVVPGLVSLSLDATQSRDVELIRIIAYTVEERAKVSGPVPVLRLGALYEFEDLMEELELYANEIKKHVGTLEIVQYSFLKDTLWPAWFNQSNSYH